MFWKKETNNWNLLRSACLQIFRKREKPETEMFQFISRERRKWFRIQPSKAEPITLRYDDKEIPLRDIGAAGLSFDNDSFSIDPLKPSLLDLPELGPAIPVRLEIITIDDKNVCHCNFKTTEEGAVERIHQYVLKRQKEILQEKKTQAEKNKQSLIQIKTETDG